MHRADDTFTHMDLFLGNGREEHVVERGSGDQSDGIAISDKEK